MQYTLEWDNSERHHTVLTIYKTPGAQERGHKYSDMVTVWPDLAKFHHFVKYLKIMTIYLRFIWFWALWHNLYIFGQILKHNLVTLYGYDDGAIHWVRNGKRINLTYSIFGIELFSRRRRRLVLAQVLSCCVYDMPKTIATMQEGQ